MATCPGRRRARRPRSQAAEGPQSARPAELERGPRRAERAEAELAKTRLVVEIQGKASELLGRLLAESDDGGQAAAVIERRVFSEVETLAGTRAACAALGRSRATHYRLRRGKLGPPAAPHPRQRLGATSSNAVLEVLRGRFVDSAPAQAWATLLDEGTYLASQSTMYRLLRANGEVRERRRQATHPPRTIPELVATGPNEVWSYDVTKLKGPPRRPLRPVRHARHLQPLLPGLDGRRPRRRPGRQGLAERSDRVAEHRPRTLTIHADRGSSMTSKPVAVLLANLKIGRTHSRPHVSNDNPYSEAGFKTLKYCPAFPERFGSREDAIEFCTAFFGHYNHFHRHSGIGLHTPASVHYGTARRSEKRRAVVLNAAYAAHPERFVNKAPTPPLLPEAAWINKPQPAEDALKIS